MQIRAPKDFWSGVMFIAFAALALQTIRGYALGSPGRMGPGFFPLVLSCVLVFIGAVLILRSFFINGDRIDRVGIVALLVIAFSVCLFAVSIETMGLVIALFLVTVVSAMANWKWRWLEIFLLAVALAVFAVAVFVYALRLPIPVWPVF